MFFTAMTFERIEHNNLLEEEDDDGYPTKKLNISSSFDLMYSENTLVANGTANSDDSTTNAPLSGENIRMITELGKVVCR